MPLEYNPEDLIDAKTLSAKLGGRPHPNTLREWAKKRYIPCFEFGRNYRFILSEVMEALHRGVSRKARIEVVRVDPDPCGEERQAPHYVGLEHQIKARRRKDREKTPTRGKQENRADTAGILQRIRRDLG